jgi:hypothetical protein
MAKSTEDNSAPQYGKKMFYECRPSEVWFPSNDILKIKENAQSAQLEL